MYNGRQFCQKLTRASGALVLDVHFEWPAQEIVALKCQNLTRALGAPLPDAHFAWPAQEIAALKVKIWQEHQGRRSSILTLIGQHRRSWSGFYICFCI